jgi:hypothetical protein
MRMAVLVGTLATTLATTVGVREAVSANLLGYWKLDEQSPGVAIDSSPGMHNGNPLGNPQQVVPGNPGKARQFGANSAIVVDNPNDKSLEPEQVTVEAWVKARTPWKDPKYGYIVVKGAVGCNNGSYSLNTDGAGNVVFVIGSAGTHVRSQIAAAADVWDGNWHHLAGTFDGELLHLCMDGVEMGEGIVPPEAPKDGIQYDGLDSNELYIGQFKEQKPGGQCPDGIGWTDQSQVIIDEVKIWDRPKNCGDGCGHKKRKHCWLHFWK